METIIQMENIVKRYGDLVALDHFCLEVKQGEIFGLLGPNGSGKSTAINCMLALLAYDKGSIALFGKPMRPDSYESKAKIGVVFQDVAVFHELTVYENIDYFCGLYITDKKKRKELTEEAITFTGLNEFRKYYPGKLSGGLLRRLNIACGIAHKPKLIFLDEPTVAVDPQSRNMILQGIKRLNREGATIVYTSHYMEEVEQICSRIAIMDKGKNIALGTKEELKAMIKTGETITIELLDWNEEKDKELLELPHVYRAEYQEERLKIQCSGGSHNLIRILDFMKERQISFGKVFSEPPTLNDVFLEITGKELRD